MFFSSVSFSERVYFVLYSLICFIWLMLSWCILKHFKQLFNKSLNAIDVSLSILLKRLYFKGIVNQILVRHGIGSSDILHAFYTSECT